MSDSPSALITGGSAGIGLATARLLIDSGWDVAIAGRDGAKLERAADELGGDVAAFAGDVGEPGEARRLIRETIDEFGRLDALVNNAGTAPLVPVAETTDELLARTFGVNAIGPAAAIAEAWATFTEQGSGVIVNTSTMATRDPFPGFFAYAASKAAVNLLTHSAAKEGQAHGIRAFAVAPGAVETEMLRGIVDTDALPEDKALAPEDVAGVILDCIEGKHDADNGGVIWVPSP